MLLPAHCALTESPGRDFSLKEVRVDPHDWIQKIGDIHTGQYDSAMNRENIVQVQAIGRRAGLIVHSEGRDTGTKS